MKHTNQEKLRIVILTSKAAFNLSKVFVIEGGQILREVGQQDCIVAAVHPS